MTVFDRPQPPFSLAITPMCRGGHKSLRWITSFALDSYFIMMNGKQGSSKCHFGVFGMGRHGIEPRYPGQLTNTQTIIYMHE